jgi:hypothetical protein
MELKETIIDKTNPKQWITLAVDFNPDYGHELTSAELTSNGVTVDFLAIGIYALDLERVAEDIDWLKKYNDLRHSQIEHY